MTDLKRGWIRAGGLEVWLPRTPVLPEHEHHAVGIRQVRGGARPVACSRRDWLEFIGRVKAGDFDIPEPPRGAGVRGVPR